jgi:hypothetical protein
MTHDHYRKHRKKIVFTLALSVLAAGWAIASGPSNLLQAAEQEKSSGPPGKQEVLLVQPPVKNPVLEKRGRGNNPVIVIPSTAKGVKLWDEAKYPMDSTESLQGNKSTQGLAGKH